MYLLLAFDLIKSFCSIRSYFTLVSFKAACQINPGAERNFAV